MLNGLYERTAEGLRWFTDDEVDTNISWWLDLEFTWRKSNPKLSSYQARKAYGLLRPQPSYVKTKRLNRDEVLEMVDMEELINITCIGDHRKFGNRMMVKCPFHDDKRASMCVYLDKKRWWCYTCNEGGTAFDLIMKSEGIDFRQSLVRLNEMFS